MAEVQNSAGAGPRFAGASASVSLGSTGASMQSLAPALPAHLEDWVIPFSPDRRKLWVEYLTAYLTHLLSYFEAPSLAALVGQTYMATDLCRWIAKLRGHYATAGGGQVLAIEVLHLMCISKLGFMAKPPLGNFAMNGRTWRLHAQCLSEWEEHRRHDA